MIRAADMFCGAGGWTKAFLTTIALSGVLGRVVAAINHDAEAIATHQANHPDVEHFQSCVYRFGPRTAVPDGDLDILMASPTCTYFSQARGSKPISWDQRWGRMTPSQVVRWCSVLNVRVLIVENVREFIHWGRVHRGDKIDPADPKGKRVLEKAPMPREPGCVAAGCTPGRPCRKPGRRGAYFATWLEDLRALGYTVDFRVLNCADYGDATTRERFFLIARKDGKPITWPAATHSEDGQGNLFGGAQRWRGAVECIEWDLEGESIFDREKPLAANTIKRIYRGAVRFSWPKECLELLREHMRERGIAIPDVNAERRKSAPLVVRTDMPKSNAYCSRSVEEPVATVTTGGGFALVEPFTFQVNQGEGRARNMRPVSDPLPTVVCKDSFGLAAPFVLSQGAGGVARSTADPVPTIPTRGAHALLVPYYRTGVARDVGQPVPTVTCHDRLALVAPVTHSDSSGRARSVDQPLPTLTSAGELAFITASFGERKGQAARVRGVDKPVPTVCATGSVRLARAVKKARRWDIRFRMLTPLELARAMSFYGYKWPKKKRAAVRQIGNAVPVFTAAALVAEALGLPRVAA